MNNQEAEFLARYYGGKLGRAGLEIQGTRMDGCTELEPCVALLTSAYVSQGTIKINLVGQEPYHKLPFECYDEKERYANMTEEEAVVIANIFGGEAYHTGGGIWVVTLINENKKLVVISNEAICEYIDEEDLCTNPNPTTICLI